MKSFCFLSRVGVDLQIMFWRQCWMVTKEIAAWPAALCKEGESDDIHRTLR